MAEKKARAKEAEEAEHENAERWLLSYADMMTLLVAFFIMMYSMSVMNLKKFDQVAMAIRSGFGGETTGGKGRVLVGRNWSLVGSDVPSSGSTGEGGKKNGKQVLQEAVKDQSFIEHLRSQIAYLKLDMSVQPILDVEPNEGNRYSLVLSDQISFPPGVATLSDANAKLISQIGSYLTNVPMKIVIEGYSGHFTGNADFTNSWDLSMARARQVGDYFIDKKDINPRRVTLMAYGEWKTVSRTRKLSMTGTGEWKPADLTAPDTNKSNDRVTVSLMMK